MAYRTLDLTLISAKDLKNVNLFSPMRVYAIATISSDGPRSQQRIAPDRNGGRNPNWNATIHFTFPAGNPGNPLLRILLRADRILGDRDVGFVQIPLRDLVASAAGDARFLSYQIRRPVSGKPKGVLNFSCKISDPITPPSAFPHLHFVAPSAAVKPEQEPVTAYPPAGYYAVQQAYGYGAPTMAMPMPMPAGYGYSPAGYGYMPAGCRYGAAAVKSGKKGRSGMGLAAGIMGGALGGLLIGDLISDGDAGYDAGF